MKLLGITSGLHERDIRRQQMCQLLRQKEHDVEEQIRRAAEGVETCFQQIALARQKRDNWHQRLEDLTARREADGVSSFEVSEARLQHNRAERDLLSKVVAWKLAEVDLKDAQGVLPLECGIELPDDCSCGECR